MKKLILSFFFLSACSSHPVLPQTSDIKVGRDEAGKNCESLGSIVGNSTKVNGTTEEALEDLKSEAVKKGANYVKIETIGALATSVRGSAYFCK